jgi:hypothetical protein
MKTILLIFTLATIAFSGQIYRWADADVQNFQMDAGVGPTLTLYFQLENDVPSGTFLRVVFPFVVPSISSSRFYEGNNRCTLSSLTDLGTASALVSAISGDNNAIFLSSPVELGANKNYAVRIVLPNIASQNAGLSGSIGLFTTTAAEVNYMVIDGNPVFADFEWVPASTTLTLADNNNSIPETQSLQSAYVQNFSFTPAQIYYGGARVRITASSRFSITGCTIVSVNNNASLVPSNWVCAVVDNVATLTAPDNLPAQKIFVSLAMTNPNAIIASGNIRVEIYRRFNGHLVEAADGNGWLRSEWSTSIASSALTNGYNQPASGVANHPIVFYKGNTAARSAYQTYKFHFKPTASAPAGFINQVTFSLGNIAASTVVQKSSVIHNLDAVANSRITCSWDTLVYTCNNVALTNSSATYFFAVRILVPNNGALTDSGFGTITARAITNPDGSTISAQLFQATYSTPSLVIIGDPHKTVGPTQFNVAADQGVFFRNTADNSGFIRYWLVGASATVFADVFGGTTNIGIDMYTNRWLQISGTQNPSGYVSAGAEGWTLNDDAAVKKDYTLFNYTAGDGTTTLFNRIKAGFSSVAEYADALDHHIFFRINGANVLRAPSLRADEAVFEIYVGQIKGFAANNTADTALSYHSRPGIYSLLYMSGPGASATPFGSLSVGLIGDRPTHVNRGRYPALLRIYGNLASGEVTSTGRLAVFFQNLVPYQAVSTNDNSVICAASTGGKQTTNITCNWVEGEDTTAAAVAADVTDWEQIVKSSRIEISWSAFSATTNTFQILIPVAIETLEAIDAYLAVIDGAAPGNSPIALGLSKSGPVVAPGNTEVTLAPDNDEGSAIARFRLTSTYKVGSVQNETFEFGSSVEATRTGYVKNTYSLDAATKVNAGVQYCAVWNFLSGASFTNNAAGSSVEDACLTYSLNVYNSETAPSKIASFGNPTKWCVFCPYTLASLNFGTFDSPSTAVTVTNLQLWNGGHKWVTGTFSDASPSIGCVFSAATTVSGAVICDEKYDSIEPNVLSASYTPQSISSISSNSKFTLTLGLTNPIARSLPLGFTGATYRIYMRTSANIIQQEGGAECLVSGAAVGATCTFAQTTTTDDDTEELTSSGGTNFQPYTFTLNNIGTSGSNNVVVTLYGLNPVAGLTANVGSTLRFSTRVIYTGASGSANLLLDVTNSTPAQNFNVSFLAAASFVPDLSGSSFAIPVRGARSSLRIPFKTAGSRDILRGEKFTIQWNSTNITVAGTGNAPANLLCEVWDSNRKFVVHFKTCAITADGIELIAGTDVPVATLSPQVIVRGYTTVDFGTVSLGGRLTAGTANTIIQNTTTTQSPANAPTSIAPPTSHVAFASGDINVTRIQNQVGGTSTLQFVIRNNAGAIATGWRIIIDFPIYYSAKLSHLQQLSFIVNNVTTNGRMIDDRCLEVIIPTAVTNASTITLRIIGISNVKFTTALNFWVALDSNAEGSDGFAQSGLVIDPAAAPEPTNTIWPYSLSWTTSAGAVPQIRSSSIFNITIHAKTALAVNHTVVLDFPQSWVPLLLASAQQGLTCSLTFGTLNGTAPNSASAVAGNFLNVAGNTIRFIATAAVAVGSQVNISCSNFRTPDGPFPANCIAESPRIGVFDANEFAPIARSSPASHHFNRAVALASPDVSLVLLNFNPAQVRVAQGTVQTQDQVAVLLSGTTPFNRGLALTIRSSGLSGITLAPNTGMAKVGDDMLAVGFQATSTASLGTYPVLFSKAESSLTGTATNAYAELPALHLTVTNERAIVTSPSGPVIIPAGGRSVPLIYSLNLAPSTDITYTIAVNDSSLTVSAPTGMTLGQVKAGMRQFHVIVSAPSSAVVGSGYVLYVTAPTGNAAFSVAPANVSITLSAPQTDVPTVTVTLDNSNPANGPLQQAVSIRIGSSNETLASLPHTLFWACAAVALNINRDLAYVRANLATPQNSSSGEAWGSRPLNKPDNAGNTILIGGLMASTNYTCRFWAVNQGEMNGSNTTTFRTLNNGGRLSRVNVQFNRDTYIPAHIQSLVCWLAQTLAAQPALIRTLAGEYCGIPPTWAPSYVSFNISNTTSYTTIPVYFLPNNMITSDNLAAQAQTNLATTAWTTTVRAAISSFATFEAFTNLNSTVPALTQANVANATSTTPLTITFSAPSNNAAGLFIAGIWVWTNTSMDPTFNILNPFTISSNDPAAIGATYFNGSVFMPATVQIPFNFTADATYALYYAASCENPSEQANTCASSVMGPIYVGMQTGTTDGGQGSTDARVLTFSLSFIFALIFSLFL